MNLLVDVGGTLISVSHLRAVSSLVKRLEDDYFFNVALEGYMQGGNCIMQFKFSDTVTAQEARDTLVATWGEYLQATELAADPGLGFDSSMQALMEGLLGGGMPASMDLAAEPDADCGCDDCDGSCGCEGPEDA